MEEPSMMKMIDTLNDEFDRSQQQAEYWKNKYKKFSSMMKKSHLNFHWDYLLDEVLPQVLDTKEEWIEYFEIVHEKENLIDFKVYTKYEMIDREFDEETFNEMNTETEFKNSKWYRVRHGYPSYDEYLYISIIK